MKRTVISLFTKYDILSRQDFKCNICNCEIAYEANIPIFDIDHIIPFSVSGNDTIENLQALCLNCHRKKSSSERKINKIEWRRICQDDSIKMAVPVSFLDYAYTEPEIKNKRYKK